METKYDAIVVGAGIAGLGIAGLLSKAGKKVLLLEKNTSVGGRAATFRKDGVVRSIGQHAALEDMRYDTLLKTLGIEGPAREYFGDLVLYYDGELKSIAELFPLLPEKVDLKEAEVMMQLVGGQLEVDMEELDGLRADEWIRRYISSDFAINLIRMATIIMTTIPFLEEMAASTVYETQTMLMKSSLTWLASNGMSEFLDAMADKVREKGGTVVTNAPVKSILLENGEATGVLVGENITEEIEGEFGGITKVEAPLVVSAVPAWEIFRMIPEEQLDPEFVKLAWNVEERTANLGFSALLPESVSDNKALIMMDYPNVGYPGTIFIPTNVCPNLAGEGQQLFEASIICDYNLRKDQKKLYAMLEGLKKDVENLFPGWDKDALWISNYFHYEEPKRSPGRAGKYRPTNKVPGVKGLYLCGDSVASRALPGMECAADSAMMCAEAILGEIP